MYSSSLFSEMGLYITSLMTMSLMRIGLFAAPGVVEVSGYHWELPSGERPEERPWDWESNLTQSMTRVLLELTRKMLSPSALREKPTWVSVKETNPRAGMLVPSGMRNLLVAA